MSMCFLYTRLQKLWNLDNDFEFIDMENDYYLIRIFDLKDYNFILQERAWLIANHYLIVQRWKPNFDPYMDKFKKIVI